MRNSKKSRNQPPAVQRAEQEAEHFQEMEEHTQAILAMQSHWSGPMPAPDDMERYDVIVPGGAQALFEEFRTEAAHRRKIESRAVLTESFERLGSRILAFLFAMGALAAAVYCANIEQPWIAAILGGGTIASVVGSMIYQRKK